MKDTYTIAVRSSRVPFKAPHVSVQDELAHQPSFKLPRLAAYHRDDGRVALCGNAYRLHQEDCQSIVTTHLVGLMTRMLDAEGTHPSRKSPVSAEQRMAAMERLYRKDPGSRLKETERRLLAAQFDRFCQGPGLELFAGSNLDVRRRVDMMLGKDLLVQAVAAKRSTQRAIDTRTVSSLTNSRQPDIVGVVRGAGRSGIHQIDPHALARLQESNEKAAIVGYSNRARVLCERVQHEANARRDAYEADFERFDQAAKLQLKRQGPRAHIA